MIRVLFIFILQATARMIFKKGANSFDNISLVYQETDKGSSKRNLKFYKFKNL